MRCLQAHWPLFAACADSSAYPQNAYQAAMYAEVLKEKDINPVREELEQIVPMKAAFDKNYAKRLDIGGLLLLLILKLEAQLINIKLQIGKILY